MVSRNVGVNPFAHGVQQLVPHVEVEVWSVRLVARWSGNDDKIFLVWIDFTFSARMSKAVGSSLAMADNARGVKSANKVREQAFMVYLDLFVGDLLVMFSATADYDTSRSTCKRGWTLDIAQRYQTEC